MRYRAVIFDMDGVLIDSEPKYNEAGEKLFRSMNLPFGQREIAAITGASGTVAGKILKEWYPEIPYSVEEFASVYLGLLLEALKNGVKELIPGVFGWIRRLSGSGTRLAVGSSSTDDMVYYVVRKFGLDPLMDAVVTCGDVKRGKPWPDIFLACADRLNVKSSDCLVIEDSANGIKAAHAAGMSCAAYLGTNRNGLDLSHADTSFEKYDDETFGRLFE